MSQRKWVRDGHRIYWDEEGPLLEHPDHCPQLEVKGEAISYTLWECIPGLEDHEEGVDEKNYDGSMEAMPWDVHIGLEGSFEIEWYYHAEWVNGLENGDEYDSEFVWREAKKIPEIGP